jgi:hypothetical protein
LSTPTYVSTKEAARRIGCSRRNLVRYCDRLLPHLSRFGPVRLLTEADVATLGEALAAVGARRRRAAAARRAEGPRRPRPTDEQVREQLERMGCGKLLNPDPE